MFKNIKNALITIFTAFIFVTSMTAMDPMLEALAFGNTSQFTTRIEQLSGVNANNIDGLFAVEQRPQTILIGVELPIPVVGVPAAYYVLLRDATTGGWSRVLIDATEWRDDFRPYFEMQGIEVHKQPYGTLETGIAAAQEASALDPSGLIGVVNAENAVFGNIDSLPAAPAAVPTPHSEPIPTVQDMLASDLVDEIPAEHSVSASGSFTYTIPIMTVAGTAGVVPEVSLQYDSGSGSGVAGYGWTMSGISSIARCPKTRVQDNESASIAWNDGDRFCLDGRRLILESGAYYGAPGSVYRTEIDSGVIVTAHGRVNDEPDYFSVAAKDGSVSHMGAFSTGGEANAKLKGQNGKTLSWSIRRFADSVGNPIWYEYFGGVGTQRIAEIKYAFGSATGPTQGYNARIQFEYDETELRRDREVNYISGQMFYSDYLLGTIKSYNNASDDLVREYRLSYVPNVGPQREYLESVTACVDQHCLPPTTFDWDLPDIDWPSANTASIDISTGSNEFGLDYQIADVNGDGFGDMLWLLVGVDDGINIPLIGSLQSGIDATYYLRYATFDGTQFNIQDVKSSQGNTSTFRVGAETVLVSPRVKLVPIDLNADGRTDAAVYSLDSGGWRFFVSTPDSNGIWSLEDVGNLGGSVGILPEMDTTFADIDADGLPDAVTESEVRYLRPSGPVDNGLRYEFSAPLSLSRSANSFARQERLLSAAGDYDGDGSIDLIYSGNHPETCNDLWIVGCVDALEFTDILSVNPDGSMDLMFTMAFETESVDVADINGDGLSDILYVHEGNYRYRLSLGDGGFGPEELIIGVTEQHSGAEMPYPVDIDRDGFVDIVRKEPFTGSIAVRYWNTYLAGTGNGGFGPATSVDTINTADQYYSFFADIAGNAISDHLVIDNSGGNATVGLRPGKDASETGNFTQHQPNGVIQTIDRPISGQLVVTYESLSRSDNYTRSLTTTPEAYYQELNGPWVVGTNSVALNKSRPLMELFAPVYIVTEVSETRPATSSSQVTTMDATATHDTQFSYTGGLVEASGRGFLGFRSMTQYDTNAGRRTQTFYRQDWPFAGVVERSETQQLEKNNFGAYISDTWRKIAEESNTWNLQEWTSSFPATAENQGTAALGSLHPIVAASATSSFDMFNGSGGTPFRTSHVETTAVYDCEANGDTVCEGYADTVTRQWRDHVGIEIGSETTEHTYNTTVLPLFYGRVDSTTVTTSRIGAATGTPRTASFSYFAAGPLQGMLETEIGVENPGVVVTYEYDNFGNVTKAKTTAGGQTRCDADVLDYDTDGRYVEHTYDCLGRQRSQVVSRNKFGDATITRSMVDTNGAFVTSESAYGVFGRRNFSKSSDGAFVHASFVDSVANCPTGTRMTSVLVESGGGQSRSCIDNQGRTLRSSVKGQDGLFRSVDHIYGNDGSMTHASVPYVDGTPSGQWRWQRTQIDALGRPETVTDADGGETTFSYTSGSITANGTSFITSIASQSAAPDPAKPIQTQRRHTDAQGNIVAAVDAANGVVRYAYDNRGNLVWTQDAGGSITTVGFDNYDRRTSIDSPDRGLWTFTYTPFGESHTVTNANGQTSTMAYDNLGRLRTRTNSVGDENTTWTYDSAANGLGALARVDDSVTGFSEIYNYDSLGRLNGADTIIDGSTYSSATTFDQFGRVFQSFDAATPSTAGPSGVVMRYASNGALNAVGDVLEIGGKSRVTYSETLDTNARGQATRVGFGRRLGQTFPITRDTSFEVDTGLVSSVTSQNRASDLLQSHQYEWDLMHNLEYRRSTIAGLVNQEDFLYDSLNRLTSYSVNGGTATSVDYGSGAQNGNIQSKSDVGSYLYGENGAGPHAATTIAGVTYAYDNNGNNTSSSDGRSLEYASFDKPTRIEKDGQLVEFSYRPDRSRYKRVETDIQSGHVTTTIYLGSVEITMESDGSRKERRRLGGAIENAHFDTSGAEVFRELTFALGDHLGSTDALVSETGQLIQRMSFDPWGGRRDASTWASLSESEQETFDTSITNRGFTEHEMLDRVGIVHMNGRVYDPTTARFLQADPLVQAPFNSQSYNRYSYVWNNPLNATDPSGYALDPVSSVAAFASNTLPYIGELARGLETQRQQQIQSIASNTAIGVSPNAFSNIVAPSQSTGPWNGVPVRFEIGRTILNFLGFSYTTGYKFGAGSSQVLHADQETICWEEVDGEACGVLSDSPGMDIVFQDHLQGYPFYDLVRDLSEEARRRTLRDSEHQEFGTLIYQRSDDTYGHTSFVRGTRDGCPKNAIACVLYDTLLDEIPEDARVVAALHSHPTDKLHSEFPESYRHFSTRDVEFARRWTRYGQLQEETPIHAIVVVPSGIVDHYNIGSGRVHTLTVDQAPGSRE